mmetsp:Transcript_11409/g.24323  ORF Transcript_11409/g.24323 Transcript_11409/m.24323 type:complete len:255 (+) Transcript_11409:1681-2445(+)
MAAFPPLDTPGGHLPRRGTHPSRSVLSDDPVSPGLHGIPASVPRAAVRSRLLHHQRTRWRRFLRHRHVLPHVGDHIGLRDRLVLRPQRLVGRVPPGRIPRGRVPIALGVLRDIVRTQLSTSVDLPSRAHVVRREPGAVDHHEAAAVRGADGICLIHRGDHIGGVPLGVFERGRGIAAGGQDGQSQEVRGSGHVCQHLVDSPGGFGDQGAGGVCCGSHETVRCDGDLLDFLRTAFGGDGIRAVEGAHAIVLEGQV